MAGQIDAAVLAELIRSNEQMRGLLIEIRDGIEQLCDNAEEDDAAEDSTPASAPPAEAPMSLGGLLNMFSKNVDPAKAVGAAAAAAKGAAPVMKSPLE